MVLLVVNFQSIKQTCLVVEKPAVLVPRVFALDTMVSWEGVNNPHLLKRCKLRFRPISGKGINDPLHRSGETILCPASRVPDFGVFVPSTSISTPHPRRPICEVMHEYSPILDPITIVMISGRNSRRPVNSGMAQGVDQRLKLNQC
jgi:hypothetical protein